jgi:hypothetical protein
MAITQLLLNSLCAIGTARPWRITVADVKTIPDRPAAAAEARGRPATLNSKPLSRLEFQAP